MAPVRENIDSISLPRSRDMLWRQGAPSPLLLLALFRRLSETENGENETRLVRSVSYREHLAFKCETTFTKEDGHIT